MNAWRSPCASCHKRRNGAPAELVADVIHTEIQQGLFSVCYVRKAMALASRSATFLRHWVVRSTAAYWITCKGSTVAATSSHSYGRDFAWPAGVDGCCRKVS